MDPILRQKCRYAVADYFAGVVSFTLFNIFRFSVLPLASKAFPTMASFIFSTKIQLEIFLLPLLCLGVYWLSGYYNQPYNKSRLQESFTTFGSSVINTILTVLLLLTNDMLIARSVNFLMIGMLWVCLFFPDYILRLLITLRGLRRIRQKSIKFNTIIIGASAQAVKMAQQLKLSQATMGYHVLGFVPLEGEDVDAAATPLLHLSDLDKVCASESVQNFIIAPQRHDDSLILSTLNQLISKGISIKIAPDSLSYITSGIRLRDIYGEPLVDLTSPSIGESAKNVKRLTDVLISSIALVLLSLPMLAISIAVKRSSRGPVLYRQTRIGYRRKPFTIYKFRSMHTDAEASGPALSKDDDPRATGVGRFLRKYRLDELPQFYNVLRGDMSLVGPRPERQFYIDQILKEAPWYVLVHQVRPGVTSWGMVKYGYASEVSQMVKRAHYDLIYLANMGTAVDFKILIYTVKTIVSGEGK